uniref:Cytochrome P450 4C1-like n=1 Tax=Diabrotica virgifera virgifera TaxID=50390 RepID=A0A6P7HEA7_DIAVI
DVFKRDRANAKTYHPIYQQHSLPFAIVNLIAPDRCITKTFSWLFQQIFLNFLKYIFFTEDVFKRDRANAKAYHPIYQQHSLPFAIVNLIAPEDIELILNNSKHIEKGAFYDFLHSWLGNGLLTSKGANWHKRRKILTPAFHFNILQEFVDVFNKETNHLVELFKSKCDQPIDLIKPVTEFTLYSIG